MKECGIIIVGLSLLLIASVYYAHHNLQLAERYITCFAPASIWEVTDVHEGRIDIKCEAFPEILMFGYEAEEEVEIGQKMEIY